MDYLYDLLLNFGLIIFGAIVIIGIVSALPYALLFAFLDRDKPSTKDSKITRLIKNENGDEYEKSYSSSNLCEHNFDSQNDVSTCELIQSLMLISFVGLLIGGIMSYFGDFAYKTIGISLVTFLAGLYFYSLHEKKNGNKIL